MYIHVHVVMYLYVHGINMSVLFSDTNVPFCPILSRWIGFQMHGDWPGRGILTVTPAVMAAPGQGRGSLTRTVTVTGTVIWNRDQWYEIRVFGTYRPGMYQSVPSTYRYVMLKMVHTSMCWYHASLSDVLSMYRYYYDMYDRHEVWHCFSFNLKHHNVPALYTQYLFPLSKVKK